MLLADPDVVRIRKTAPDSDKGAIPVVRGISDRHRYSIQNTKVTSDPRHRSTCVGRPTQRK